MDTQKEYLSQEKLEQLQEELIKLKTTDRKVVAGRLEEAKALGDLSENAEYHEAREQQADIEDRIKVLSEMLKDVVVFKSKHGQVVDIGSNVVVKKDGNSEVSYMIVGSEEADMSAHKISFQSPIGGALLGKHKGDEIKVTTPKGEVVYSIIDIK